MFESKFFFLSVTPIIMNTLISKTNNIVLHGEIFYFFAKSYFLNRLFYCREGSPAEEAIYKPTVENVQISASSS